VRPDAVVEDQFERLLHTVDVELLPLHTSYSGGGQFLMEDLDRCCDAEEENEGNPIKP
jgi:hypothetical protein